MIKRPAQLNLDCLEKRRHIADLTEYFKISITFQFQITAIFFPFQIILVLVVITIKSTKNIHV